MEALPERFSAFDVPALRDACKRSGTHLAAALRCASEQFAPASLAIKESLLIHVEEEAAGSNAFAVRPPAHAPRPTPSRLASPPDSRHEKALTAHGAPMGRGLSTAALSCR